MKPVDIAQTLVAQHGDMLAGSGCTPAEATHPDDVTLSVRDAGLLQGLRMLGFLEHDARCVAQAWQARTQRTGEWRLDQWPDAAEDFDIPAWPRAEAFPTCPQRLGLYAVLPDARWVERMALAGVPTLQLRFKSDDTTAIRREVKAAMAAVRGSGSLLFINDHWQIAIEEGAYGVHLGQEDLSDAPLQRLRESGLRLGLSTHGYAEMLRADAVSPSYLALGAVFPTTLKRMVTAPQGLGRLKAYARLMRHHSLVAIGGIDADRFPQVLASGVGSIAVVRAITGADHPEWAAQDLMAKIS